MANKPLPGFKSFETQHCYTGSMKHIYEFYGYPICEEMLLGLGAGVGFIYWHMKGTTPFYGGRANLERPGQEGMEKTAGRRTGVLVESFRTSSKRKAEKSLVELLQRGEPVMLQVDMGYLPYLDLPEEYHFGAHIVAVGGYDPERQLVLLADRDKELHPVTLETLAQARGSQYKPFPPKHKWYTFDFSKAHPPKPEETLDAIREVTLDMIEPPISNLGVKGIRKAAARTLKWPESMDEEELRWTCFNIYIFIDAIGGTGGGIFRYMYGRFLAEAASITGDGRLMEVSELMRDIGDQWQQVAEMFKEAAEANDPAVMLPKITTPMLVIADKEQQAWERLGEIVSY